MSGDSKSGASSGKGGGTKSSRKKGTLSENEGGIRLKAL
jgi:hypothetical protein